MMMFRIISALFLVAALAAHYRLTGKILPDLSSFRVYPEISKLHIYGLYGFALMLISGFTHLLLFGEPMSGLLLLLHMAIAPFLALLMVAIIAISAGFNFFSEEDFSGRLSCATIQKIIFWLFSMLSLILILSALLTMFSFFSLEQSNILLTIHRYTALLMSVLVIIYFGCIKQKQ